MIYYAGDYWKGFACGGFSVITSCAESRWKRTDFITVQRYIQKEWGLKMKNLHKMLGLALMCGSLTLVGCGGGGGGGGGGGSNDVETAPVALAPAPAPEEELVVGHGAPEDENPVVDTELVQPVEDVAVLPEDLASNPNPNATVPTPEPATVALGALGVVFLASRRYRRKA